MIDTGGLVFSLRCMPGARRYLRMVLPYVFPRIGLHMRNAEARIERERQEQQHQDEEE